MLPRGSAPHELLRGPSGVSKVGITVRKKVYRYTKQAGSLTGLQRLHHGRVEGPASLAVRLSTAEASWSHFVQQGNPFSTGHLAAPPPLTGHSEPPQGPRRSQLDCS